MTFGWIDDGRATALWEAADRAFAIYRLYAEEIAARALHESTPEVTRATQATLHPATPPSGPLTPPAENTGCGECDSR